MLGRSHMACSEALALTALTFGPGTVLAVHPILGTVMVAGVGAGAIMPDLDTPNSLASQKYHFTLAGMFTHRGFLHSIFAWGLFSAALYWLAHHLSGVGIGDWSMSICWCLALGLSFGYLAHLVEDSFSQAGIRWLNPLTPYDQMMMEKYHTLLRPVHHFDKVNGRSIPCRHWWGRGYKTGGDGEIMIVGLAWIVVAVCLVRVVWLWFHGV